jgi:hypothetical protein
MTWTPASGGVKFRHIFGAVAESSEDGYCAQPSTVDQMPAPW